MKCKNCGKEFEGKFCPDCGTMVECEIHQNVTKCPNCGAERIDNGKFCINCGYNFEDSTQSSYTGNGNIQSNENGNIGINKKFDLSKFKKIFGKIYRWFLAGGMLFIGLVALLCLSAPTITEEFLGEANNLCSGFVALGGGNKVDVSDSVVNASRMLLVMSLLCLAYGGVQLFFAFKKPYGTFKKYYSWGIDGVISLILIILGGVVSTAAKSDEFMDGKLGYGFAMCVVMGVFGLVFLGARIFYELKVFKWEDTGLSEEQIARATEKKERKSLDKAQIKKLLIRVGIPVLVIVVLIAVIVPSVTWANNIFRVGKVDKINIGNSQEQVIKILGEPYEKSDYRYEYYSKDYIKVLEQIEKLSESKSLTTNMSKDDDWGFDLDDDIDLDKEIGGGSLSKLEKLYKQLNEMNYKYIRVDFDSNKKVTEVFFDNDKNNSRKVEENKKQVKSYELNLKELVRFTKTDINYSIRYSDNSYVKGIVAKGLINIFDIDYPVEWKDNYGNIFNSTLKTKNIEKPSNFEIEGDVTVPYGVLAIDDIFANSKITGIVIPNSVTSIKAGAFKNCNMLKQIEIPNSVQSISQGAFKGCNSLESISLPFVGSARSSDDASMYAASRVDNLYFGYIFGYDIPTSLKHVTLECENIPGFSFDKCSNIESITIKDGLKRVGQNAFGQSGCNIKKIEFEGDLASWCGIEFEHGAYGSGNPLKFASEFYVQGKLVSNELIIPNGVTRLGECVFDGISGITKVYVPGSVKSIGSYAFYGKETDDIIICCEAGSKPNGWANNWNYKASWSSFQVLWNCKEIGCTDSGIDWCLSNLGGMQIIGYSGNLTQVIIPSLINGHRVTEIIEYAFYGCSELTSIEIPSNVTNIGNNAFYGCNNLTIVTMPAQAISYIPKNNLKTVVINGGTSIDDGAFQNCSSLISIEIFNTVTRIGNFPFQGCSNLTSIKIPNSVTSIGNNAFEWCRSLASIVIPSGVTSIGYAAFSCCDSLTSVTFENTSGWYVASTSNAISGTNIDVTNATQNATQLTSPYTHGYWKCK